MEEKLGAAAMLISLIERKCDRRRIAIAVLMLPSVDLAAGYYAHERSSPLFPEHLRNAFEAGLKKRW